MLCNYEIQNLQLNLSYSTRNKKMNVKVEDRPIEQVKQEVIDVLIHNYSHSVISNEAFERRLDTVIESKTAKEMLAQIEDLPEVPDDTVKKHKEEEFSVNYSYAGAEENCEKIFNVLSESDRSGAWIVPKTIKIYTLLGSSKIDFTHARFSSPNVSIKVYSILGSDKIYIPENINVVTKALSVVSSMTNKAPSVSSQKAPTVTVEGVMILSEMTIKVKTTMKESFIAFANKMKAMFDEKGY